MTPTRRQKPHGSFHANSSTGNSDPDQRLFRDFPKGVPQWM